MIAEVKGARLLQGFRGRPAADLEALADTLVRMSHLAMHLEGHLAELDINPLMVLPSGQGVKAVDALVVFAAHSSRNLTLVPGGYGWSPTHRRPSAFSAAAVLHGTRQVSRP
jgi:hypothetical protein